MNRTNNVMDTNKEKRRADFIPYSQIRSRLAKDLDPPYVAQNNQLILKTTEEKKVVSKKRKWTHPICEHNTRKSDCQKCGHRHCEHNTRKSDCRICGDRYCSHDRRKNRCNICRKDWNKNVETLAHCEKKSAFRRYNGAKKQKLLFLNETSTPELKADPTPVLSTNLSVGSERQNHWGEPSWNQNLQQRFLGYQVEWQKRYQDWMWYYALCHYPSFFFPM